MTPHRQRLVTVEPDASINR